MEYNHEIYHEQLASHLHREAFLAKSACHVEFGNEFYDSYLEYLNSNLDYVNDADETSQKRIDAAYKAYHEAVNMSASELEAWAKTECSKKASLNRSPITRNLRILRTPKSEWTMSTVRSANRTVSFISRMKGAEQGEPAVKGCPSKRDISLRNWAYNPSK